MASKRGRDDNQKKMARLRFRNLVRSVMFNRIWLMDVGDQKLSLNVKKNIAMLVRPQRKVGMLTMAEKTLLRTHHAMRSIEDRKKLVNLLAGLTCFSRLPPKVRARLASVIKFMFIGTGRKIIKEGDPPSSIYFVLSGEVEITRRVYDHLKNEWVDKVDSICGSGDCLGDIELVEGCDRMNTYTTTNEVELLVLHHEDFDSILRPVMSKQWEDRKAAILALDYFKYLNREQRINACKLGIIRQFEPLETICYEDKGHVSYVHFVLSGECMILQCLKMKATTKKGIKTFELVDLKKDEDEKLLADVKGAKITKLHSLNESKSIFNVDQEIDSIDRSINAKVNKMVQKMDLRSIEISCGLKPSSIVEEETEYSVGLSNEMYSDGEDISEYSDDSSHVYNHSENEGLYSHTNEYNRNSSHIRNLASRISKSQVGKKLQLNDHKKENIPPSDVRPDKKYGLEQNKNDVNMDSKLFEENYTSEPVSLTKLSKPKQHASTKIENHFIDVASLTFGGVFGLGEKLEHRVIMARTTVQCLMLPRYWLFEREQNPGNMWQRRRFYLDTTVPSRDSLFMDFLTTRTWQKFKTDIISSNVTKYFGNPTKVQDIPIICRIVEPSEE